VRRRNTEGHFSVATDHCELNEERASFTRRCSPTTTIADLESASMRGFLKRLRYQRDVRRHLDAHHGMFVYAGRQFTVDDRVKLDVRHALATGNYECEEIELARRHLPRTLPVIELGGCLGVVSGVLRGMIDPAMPLIVVEANAEIIGMTKMNAARPAPNAPTEIILAAVHYGSALAQFHIAHNAHASRLAGETTAANGSGLLENTSIALPAITLNQLVARLGPPQHYALMCDIEGAEFDMFAMDTDALRLCQGAVIEMHPEVFTQAGRSVADFLAHVAAAGLTVVEQQSDVIALMRA
jgi:FkbM family methyltransferase